ncbi:phage terminase large subunit family protein [Rhizobium sp. RMa-01]|uniref:phage terminase large subunit family protein n=1 Tax=unclassified Rhizobium TaxID=2613769 RepID=UPI0008DA8FD5|nr:MULTISPECIES: phage terminase large subunit family protein [unclassified Rhizobium]OHV26597.1 terminase [Rhizobium sp. RSm-3]RVU10175.1 phage terminase large subunit family protein [Rhizobium sp. RMa-01]
MTNETLASIRRNALAALRPPPRQALSSWIERHLSLPDGVSSLPGAVRLWPFQREIADAIGDPFIERVTLVKPVRVGFTTLITGALGGYIANDPSPILCLLPTEADCRDYMVSDIEPIFAASPVLAGLIGDDQDDGGRNTILSRRFPGGSLKVVAAKAPRNLRRHNVRVLLCDEVDGMENGAEGSPILLAEKRTLSFADRKIVIGSTPVFEDTSHVLRSYGQSDARVYEVPCPECGDFHEIGWGDIQWPAGEPHRAYYVCKSCGCIIEERHKPAMVALGRWRATQPHVTGHAGFRLNALVSLLPNASWGKLASEFVAAKDDPAHLQTFINTILAQGWRETGEELDDREISGRAEAFSLEEIPAGVLAITVGVDVQRDRLEVTFIGWDREGAAHVLAHLVVWGRTDQDATWHELDGVLKQRFHHPLGGEIGIDATAIDSGDGETMEAVYRFAFPRYGMRVFAIKGVAGNRPWIERSKSKIQGGRLWIVGVDGIKSHLTSCLGRNQAIRFSKSLPAVFYEQLASERVVVRYSRGQPQRRFERVPGRQAEALDCCVYAFAARQLLNINWDQRRADLSRTSADATKPVPNVVKSRWMGR